MLAVSDGKEVVEVKGDLGALQDLLASMDDHRAEGIAAVVSAVDWCDDRRAAGRDAGVILATEASRGIACVDADAAEREVVCVDDDAVGALHHQHLEGAAGLGLFHPHIRMTAWQEVLRCQVKEHAVLLWMKEVRGDGGVGVRAESMGPCSV